MSKKTILVLFFLCLFSCIQKETTPYQTLVQDPQYLHQSVKKLTDIIVHDIFSPPVASRNYVYPNIAAYEVFRHDQPKQYKSLATQLNGLQSIPQPETEKEYSFSVAGILTFLEVGKHFVFSKEKLTTFQKEIEVQFKESGIPSKTFDNSKIYAQKVAKHIIAWADKDNYKQTRTFPKYSIKDSPEYWLPTPPDYMDGIEPHWNKIRTFVLDSATQFVPPPPPPFSIEKGSEFYEDVMEVYETVNKLDSNQTNIASFWDCNPYVSHHKGHVMFATKKITPGGHWMGIAQTASRLAKADLLQTSEAYTLVAIALADAFISCWDEKYRSNLIRPETIINQHIDPDWIPPLQTPPFPEYTSGHSVISNAAAVSLTELFGDSFHFIDSTEVEYGLPPRTFESFKQAAEEAAISRLYGGIHYMPAIEYGVTQGKNVGNFIVANIDLKVKTSQ